jgi:dual specificity phosphatase 12
MVWMQANELIGQEEGKINCPSCFARLGTWAWAGFDCECTKKVVPAFKITRSKVERQDVSKRE